MVESLKGRQIKVKGVREGDQVIKEEKLVDQMMSLLGSQGLE